MENKNVKLTINTQEEEKKISNVPALIERAESVVITDQAGYDLAADVLKEVKEFSKELDKERKAITNPIDAAKKKIMDLFKAPLDALSNAESKLKKMMIGYVERKDREAEAERKRLQELADREAEKERNKLEKKIEAAKDSGNIIKAKLLENSKEEIQSANVVVSSKHDTPVGVSFREKWYAEVIDENLVPREYLIVNQQALDRIAVATKGTVKIPGVEFKFEKILASRKD